MRQKELKIPEFSIIIILIYFEQKEMCESEMRFLTDF